MDLPRAFGRYVLFDLIGRGGMADIYLARMDNSLGGHRLCVIKEIRDTFDDDPAFVELLTAEAKLAAKLNHANVVQVFDLGRENGRLFLAMDYVEGYDLHQLLRQLSKSRIALPAEFAFTIIIETLRGLDYAHRARDEDGEPLGIVHRDVSPSNVLISFEGEVKLCDFGIARAMKEPAGDENAIAKSRVAGKAAYMSPEHAQGELLDGRADVFAAGILLWELCAGRRLYRGEGSDVLELAKAAQIPELPERGIPGTPELKEILGKALARDVNERYASASEFLDELESFAIKHRLRASPLRFGSFLADHFAAEIIEVRRERERSATAVPAAHVENLGPTSMPPGAIEPDLASIEDEQTSMEIGADELLGDTLIEEELEASDETSGERERSDEGSLIPPAGASGALALGALPETPSHPPSFAPPPPAKPTEQTPAKVTAPESSSLSDGKFFTLLFVASLVLATLAYVVVKYVA